MTVLGEAYDADPTTVKSALARQGAEIRTGPRRRPRADPNPEWAEEAARRYTAREPSKH